MKVDCGGQQVTFRTAQDACLSWAGYGQDDSGINMSASVTHPSKTLNRPGQIDWRIMD